MASSDLRYRMTPAMPWEIPFEVTDQSQYSSIADYVIQQLSKRLGDYMIAKDEDLVEGVQKGARFSLSELLSPNLRDGELITSFCESFVVIGRHHLSPLILGLLEWLRDNESGKRCVSKSQAVVARHVLLVQYIFGRALRSVVVCHDPQKENGIDVGTADMLEKTLLTFLESDVLASITIKTQEDADRFANLRLVFGLYAEALGLLSRIIGNRLPRLTQRFFPALTQHASNSKSTSNALSLIAGVSLVHMNFLDAKAIDASVDFMNQCLQYLDKKGKIAPELRLEVLFLISYMLSHRIDNLLPGGLADWNGCITKVFGIHEEFAKKGKNLQCVLAAEPILLSVHSGDLYKKNMAALIDRALKYIKPGDKLKVPALEGMFFILAGIAQRNTPPIAGTPTFEDTSQKLMTAVFPKSKKGAKEVVTFEDSSPELMMDILNLSSCALFRYTTNDVLLESLRDQALNSDRAYSCLLAFNAICQRLGTAIGAPVSDIVMRHIDTLGTSTSAGSGGASLAAVTAAVTSLTAGAYVDSCRILRRQFIERRIGFGWDEQRVGEFRDLMNGMSGVLPRVFSLVEPLSDLLRIDPRTANRTLLELLPKALQPLHFNLFCAYVLSLYRVLPRGVDASAFLQQLCRWTTHVDPVIAKLADGVLRHLINAAPELRGLLVRQYVQFALSIGDALPDEQQLAFERIRSFITQWKAILDRSSEPRLGADGYFGALPKVDGGDRVPYGALNAACVVFMSNARSSVRMGALELAKTVRLLRARDLSATGSSFLLVEDLLESRWKILLGERESSLSALTEEQTQFNEMFASWHSELVRFSDIVDGTTPAASFALSRALGHIAFEIARDCSSGEDARLHGSMFLDTMTPVIVERLRSVTAVAEPMFKEKAFSLSSPTFLSMAASLRVYLALAGAALARAVRVEDTAGKEASTALLNELSSLIRGREELSRFVPPCLRLVLPAGADALLGALAPSIGELSKRKPKDCAAMRVILTQVHARLAENLELDASVSTALYSRFITFVRSLFEYLTSPSVVETGESLMLLKFELISCVERVFMSLTATVRENAAQLKLLPLDVRASMFKWILSETPYNPLRSGDRRGSDRRSSATTVPPIARGRGVTTVGQAGTLRQSRGVARASSTFADDLGVESGGSSSAAATADSELSGSGPTIPADDLSPIAYELYVSKALQSLSYLVRCQLLEPAWVAKKGLLMQWMAVLFQDHDVQVRRIGVQTMTEVIVRNPDQSMVLVSHLLDDTYKLSPLLSEQSFECFAIVLVKRQMEISGVSFAAKVVVSLLFVTNSRSDLRLLAGRVLNLVTKSTKFSIPMTMIVSKLVERQQEFNSILVADYSADLAESIVDHILDRLVSLAGNHGAILTLLPEWLRTIDLQQMRLLELDTLLQRLSAVTLKFGDRLHAEAEKIWRAAAAGGANNVDVILAFVANTTLRTRNPWFFPTARRLLTFMARDHFDKVVADLSRRLWCFRLPMMAGTGSSVSLHAIEDPDSTPIPPPPYTISSWFFVDLLPVMRSPLTESDYAKFGMAELLVESPDELLGNYGSTLLYFALLGLDSHNVHLREVSLTVLQNVLQALLLSTSTDVEVGSRGGDLLEQLRVQALHIPMWPYEDPHNGWHDLPSARKLSAFVTDLLAVCSNVPNIALNLAAVAERIVPEPNGAVHYVYRSLQILRALRIPLSGSLLKVLMQLYHHQVSKKGNEQIMVEVLITLDVLIQYSSAEELVGQPSVYWFLLAVLYGNNEQLVNRSLQCLIDLLSVPGVLNRSGEFAAAVPATWPAASSGLVHMVLKASTSAVSIDKAVELASLLATHTQTPLYSTDSTAGTLGLALSIAPTLALHLNVPRERRDPRYVAAAKSLSNSLDRPELAAVFADYEGASTSEAFVVHLGRALAVSMATHAIYLLHAVNTTLYHAPSRLNDVMGVLYRTMMENTDPELTRSLRKDGIGMFTVPLMMLSSESWAQMIPILELSIRRSLVDTVEIGRQDSGAVQLIADFEASARRTWSRSDEDFVCRAVESCLR